MAKQIKRTDIAETDLYKDIRDSATKTIVEINKVNQELQKTAQVIASSLKGELDKTTKSIENFSKNVTTMNAVVDQSIKMDEAKAKALKVQLDADIKLQKLQQEKEKTAQQQLRTQAQQEKAAKANARAVGQETDAYKKLVIATRDQKNQSKALGAELLELEKNGQKNTKAFKDLEKRYKEVTKAAQQGDVELKKLDKTVGDNFRNVGNYSSALDGLKGALGKVGLAFGIGSVVTDAFGTIKQFDQSVQDLSAITGASGAELDKYRESAIEMGKGVVGGAAATVEAFKLIGSAKPELLANADSLIAVTDAAITLSKAAGMDLPEAATALTDAMNQFGAPAEEAGRFINVLAAGSKFGSAEIPQVTEALLKFGAAAKNSNVSIEESTALIEDLAEKGLKGAEAGTAIRNVLLKIGSPDALPKEAQDRLKDLGISFEDLTDTTKPLADRLDVLKPLLKDQTTLIKVFGTENAIAATNILSTTDRLRELTTQVTGTNTANEQAAIRAATLNDAINRLKESWNAIVLSFQSGTGVAGILTKALMFLANNLGTIVKTIGAAAGIFATYKVTVTATNAITKAYTATMALMNLAFGKNAIATKGADVAMKAFNATTKANPIGLLVTVLATAVTAFFAFRDSASEAEKAQKRLNDAVKAGEEQGKRAASTFRAVTEDRFKQIEDQAKRMRLQGEDAAKVDKWVLEQKKAFQEQENDFIDFNIKKREKQTKATVDANKAEIAALDERIKKQEQLLMGSISDGQRVIVQNQIKSLKSQQRALETSSMMSIKNFESYKSNLLKSRDELDSQILASSEEVVNADKEAAEKLNAAQQKRQQELDLLRKRAEDLEDARIEDEFKRKEQQLKRAFEREMQAIKGNSEIENRLRKELELKLNNDILELQKDRHAKSLKLVEDALASVDKKYEDGDKKRQDDDEKMYQMEVKAAEKRTKQAESENLDKITDQKQFDIEEQKRLIAHLKEMLAIQKAYGKDAEALDTEIQIKKAEKQLETMEKETTAVKDNSEVQKKIIEEVTNYAIKKTDERIAAIDKEIAAAQRQAEFYEKLAAEGNITAEQSLLEQQKIIDEAEKEREQLERRKQQIQLISAGVSTYQSKVAAGDQSPLLNTIKDITLLTQFLSNLPAFFDGTEDTGQGGGIDGKGGFHAVLHPHERVIPASENAKLKGLSNTELADVGMKYKNGQLVDFRARLGMQDKRQTNELLLKEIKDLKEVISNQPQTDWNIGEVTQESFNLIKRTVSKNTVVYNKFRMKK